MSATRTEAVTASEHLGMLNSSLEFVNQKLHNNLTRPSVIRILTNLIEGVKLSVITKRKREGNFADTFSVRKTLSCFLFGCKEEDHAQHQ